MSSLNTKHTVDGRNPAGIQKNPAKDGIDYTWEQGMDESEVQAHCMPFFPRKGALMHPSASCEKTPWCSRFLGGKNLQHNMYYVGGLWQIFWPFYYDIMHMWQCEISRLHAIKRKQAFSNTQERQQWKLMWIRAWCASWMKLSQPGGT